ncbi:MAG: 2-amino-4-hydroxy-6-hydroxymethyldihydropteridine diphosphokinase [Solirubrobacteraceae bacterium]
MNFKVELALGANLGSREDNIQKAIEELALVVGKVIYRSKMVETEPYGFLSPNNFLNIIIIIETKLNPSELLKKTKQIEKQLGRDLKVKDSTLYQDRPIDIDILKFENINFISKQLNIPHLKINERFFFNINWLNNQ